MRKQQATKSNWNLIRYTNNENEASSVIVHQNEFFNDKLDQRQQKIKFGVREHEIKTINSISVIRAGNGQKAYKNIERAKAICEKLTDEFIPLDEFSKEKEYWDEFHLVEAAIKHLKKVKKEIKMHHDFNTVADWEEVK